MKTRIFSLLLSLIALMAGTSCTSTPDLEGAIPSNAIYALATVVNSTAEGAIFDYQKDETSQPERLVALGEKIDLAQTPIGSRVLIAFKYQASSSSIYGTEIALYYVGPIFNGDLKYMTSDQAFGFSSNEVTLESVWLTGDFLNMALTLDYGQSMHLNLVCDQTTADNELPVLYLIFEADNLASGYPHSGYASFNISSLREKMTCQGFTVKIKDLKTGGTFTKTFPLTYQQ